MKKDIQPENYRKVIFHDNASGEDFLISSTIETEETGKYDGTEYPLVNVEISSPTHQFYTGPETRLDTAGRAEKFRKRAEQAQK